MFEPPLPWQASRRLFLLMPHTTFDAAFQSLDAIRQFVAESARQAGFSDRDIYAIQLAADEACTNIIEHAYGQDPSGQIEIDCQLLQDEFKIVIRDRGKSFDPARVPEPKLNVELSQRKIGGLGMYMMRRLMDKVDYHTSPQEGNVLTMIKYKGRET